MDIGYISSNQNKIKRMESEVISTYKMFLQLDNVHTSSQQPAGSHNVARCRVSAAGAGAGLHWFIGNQQQFNYQDIRAIFPFFQEYNTSLSKL